MRKIILAVLMLAGSAAAQEELINTGREALASQDLQAADAAFRDAAAAFPEHPESNVLYGVTRLLVLAETEEFRNQFFAMGASSVSESLYNFDIVFPYAEQAGGDMDILFDEDYNTSAAKDYITNTLLPEIAAAGSNLAVAGEGFALDLSAAETGDTGVTVDYGDILVLRALMKAACFYIHFLEGFGTDVNLFEIMQMNSLPEILEAFPNLMQSSPRHSWAEAETALRGAIALYGEASPILRGRAGEPRLFTLAPEDLEGEAELRESLEHILGALDGPVLAGDGDIAVHFGPVFDGAVNPRALLPEFSGESKAVAGTVPDPTFGGLLPGMTQGKIEDWLFENGLSAGFLAGYEAADGLLHARPFGYFSYVGSFLYHYEHGWLYPYPMQSDIWMWDYGMRAWLWTSSRCYPSLFYFSGGESAWLFYYQGSARPRWFLNYDTGKLEAHW